MLFLFDVSGLNDAVLMNFAYPGVSKIILAL